MSRKNITLAVSALGVFFTALSSGALWFGYFGKATSAVHTTTNTQNVDGSGNTVVGIGNDTVIVGKEEGE